MELPDKFRTWVEFYDLCKRLPDFETLETVIVMQPDPQKAHLTERVAESDKIEVHFPVTLIQKNALEEMLAERFNKDEIIYLFNYIFKEMGRYTEENPFSAELRKAKRILLTQAKT